MDFQEEIMSSEEEVTTFVSEEVSSNSSSGGILWKLRLKYIRDERHIMYEWNTDLDQVRLGKIRLD